MSRTHARRLALGGVTLALVAGSATAAEAAHQGQPGRIAYTVGTTTYAANPDGSGEKAIASDVATLHNGGWSPDGSRYAFGSIPNDLKTVRQDGGPALGLTDPALGGARDPAWSPDGRRVYYARGRALFWAYSDTPGYEVPLIADEHGFYDYNSPSVSDTGVIIFDQWETSTNVHTIVKYNPDNPVYPITMVDGGATPDFAPGGATFVYVSAGNLWTASTSNPATKVQLTTTGDAKDPEFSPDGTKVLFVAGGAIKSVTVATKAVATVKNNAGFPSWQGLQRNSVERVWGNDGTETAIATSQWNYRNVGAGSDSRHRIPAGAVVLSRSDTYLDALVGSALAIKEHAPLLITAPGSSVEARVLTEIKRILGTSGDVYLLGGTLALPAGIESQLAGLGYTVHRIWGQNHYETALAINQQLTGGQAPETAIVTTGANYYDALAAGAAAGANPGTVIVLTNGTTMPAASAAYLNSLNPDWRNGGTMIVTAGGPGDTALNNTYLPNWPDGSGYYALVGNNEKDTAVALAQFFFAAPTSAALSTNRGWQDALTGGAMIGGAGGPLLLTDPNTLYGPVADYLSGASASIGTAVMLGGYLALPDALIQPIGNAICVPGQYDYTSSSATTTLTLRAQPTSTRPATATQPGPHPGTPTTRK